MADGTLDHLATDHAAYADAEKVATEGDFPGAPPGHPGLETLLPILLDGVAAGHIGLERAVAVTASSPAERFRLPAKGRIAAGADADLVLVDLGGETEVRPDRLLTAARASARLAHGARWRGRIVRTLLCGRTVWDGAEIRGPAAGRFVTPAAGDAR